MTTQQFINQLSGYIFWDMDMSQMDADKHCRQIIQRVLEYGQLSDWRLARDYYGLDRVVEECKAMRTLDPKALSFVCAISKTSKNDYRCYHFKQSFPTLWNS